jgi:hypothetical protein
MEKKMSKYQGIPGRVVFRVTAIYYPIEGNVNVSDLFSSDSIEGALDNIRSYIAHLEANGMAYLKPRVKTKEYLEYEMRQNPNYVEKEVPVEIHDPVEKPTKGEHMVGKVWMLHHGLKQRARVEPDKVEEYRAKGYVIGGPKTKF